MTQLFTLFLTLLSIPSAYRMMVITDLHMLDSAQYVESSTSFQNQINYDRKHPDLTDAAFTALMDSALNLRPDVVLVPGDLTYLGAKADHLAAADQLRRLTDAGIPVCLIPGNHDIVYNSYAYWGEYETQVPSVTDAQFDSIYAFCNTPFTNRRQDPNGSHSYVQTIAPRLTLLGFDGNHYDVDGVAYLNDATLNWMMAQADSAVQAGDRVIAMLHQQMIEPIDNASAIQEESFISNRTELINVFCAHGIDLLLTGHVHINDVSVDYGINGDSLVEISTACAPAYPLPFRMITATDTFSYFNCETHYIQSLPGHNNIQNESRTKTENYMKNVIIPMVVEWAWAQRDTLPTMIDAIELPSALSTVVSKDDLKGLVNDLLNAAPQTAAGRAAMVNQYLGNDVASATLVHMDGNEGNQNTTSLQSNLWTDAQNLVNQLIEDAYPNSGSVATKIANRTKRKLYQSVVSAGITYVKTLDVVKNQMTSLFEDYTHVGETTQNCTDDLTPHLAFTHLTYMPTVYTEFAVTDCDSYVWNSKTYTQSGDYKDTLQTIHGCDSIVTMHLTINQSVSTEFSAANCDSYVWNSKTYTQSGDYKDTLQTIHGCDSIVTMHLTINQSVSTEFTAANCDSYVWNSKTYTQSGDYKDTLQTIHGCDSIVTMHLTINKSVSTEFNAANCDSYVWNSKTYTQSGDYKDTLQTIHGCDSIVTMHLTINKSVSTEFNAENCDSYVWNSKTYTQSGDYKDTLQTIHGCDSIVTMHLTINKSVSTEFSAANCDSYVWNSKTYTQSGDYKDTLQNIHSCDSIVTMHLTINKSISTEFSDSAYVEYVWNEQTYTQSGDYTQTLQTVHGCDSVVTLHLTILKSPGTDILSPMALDVVVYPNPASEQIYIQGEDIQGVEVYSAAGQLVERVSATNAMDIHHWAKGVYVLRIKQNDVYVYRQVIKQ